MRYSGRLQGLIILAFGSTSRLAMSTVTGSLSCIEGPSSGPEWWCKGRKGHLPPWGQAIIWAAIRLRDSLDLDLSDPEIGCLVQKSGCDGETVGKCAIKKWRDLMSADPDWYPNKTQEHRAKPGPKRLRTEEVENEIAQTAMTLKESGVEPSAALVKQVSPDACINPETDEFFTDKYILEVFKTRCFDPGSDVPWGQWHPLQKTALPHELKVARTNWGRGELKLERGGGWYYRHVIWMDPCYSILSNSPRQIFAIEKAADGKRKRWASKDCLMYSRNLKSSAQAGKQKQKGDRKVWWFMILARGRVHIQVMGESFQQTGSGMANVVANLDKTLRKMVGRSAALPRIVMTDRGPGFFNSLSGRIVKAYGEALQTHGFRPFAGEDASQQPPDIPDLLLHETAIGWVRNYMRKHPFDRSGSLDDQENRLRSLLSECASHINAEYDVDGLCYRFPGRLQEMIDKQGERLRN